MTSDPFGPTLPARLRGLAGAYFHALGEVVEGRAEPGEILIAAVPLLAGIFLAVLALGAYAIAGLTYDAFVLPMLTIGAWVHAQGSISAAEQPTVALWLASLPLICFAFCLVAVIGAYRNRYTLVSSYPRLTILAIVALFLAWLTSAAYLASAVHA
jgi:hypothetical protein